MFNYSTRIGLETALQEIRYQNGTIGFVPTMGALHEGHLSLVSKASNECDVVVVSIFVNPNQFNNREDFLKYPNTLENDLKLLSQFQKVMVFVPSVEEVYPKEDSFEPIDLGKLDTVLEGKYRPGHFQGVVHVVRNLLQIVNPERAYFGLKDYQQLAVIKKFISILGVETQIIPCETLRDTTGLAMSSRNLRLSEREKKDALIIHQTLLKIKDWKRLYSPEKVKEMAVNFFNKGLLKLEYLEIIDGIDFATLNDEWTPNALCCIAAYCGEVRLIDNMSLQ